MRSNLKTISLPALAATSQATAHPNAPILVPPPTDSQAQPFRSHTACLHPAILFTGSADPTLTRELGRVLHLLYVSAGVLAVLLVLILAFAAWIYRRNKAKEPTR